MKAKEIIITDEIEEFFWKNVIITGFTPCWEWVGGKAVNGYSRIQLNSPQRIYLAHRVAFTLLKGPLDLDLVIDHLCRNRGCVNPDHMEQVTAALNTKRGERSLRTTCPSGHPLDGVAVRSNGYKDRYCKTCKNERARRTGCNNRARNERTRLRLATTEIKD